MFELINSIITHFYKEVNMTVHFVYMWYDTIRRMFYVGQHTGSYDDQYTTSSRWLAGEIRYRPHDFKRRIIKTFHTKNEAQKYEGYLLTLIKPHEFGSKYYNMKQGKPIGTPSWNSGKSGIYTEEHRKRISDYRKGKPTTKGKRSAHSAENGKKGAAKLSTKATGRTREYREDGSWTWKYPEAN